MPVLQGLEADGEKQPCWNLKKHPNTPPNITPKPQNNNKNKPHKMFPRDSLKVKFVMSRTGPGPKLGIHLVPCRYFPSLILGMGFPELRDSEPGFGSGSP